MTTQTQPPTHIESKTQPISTENLSPKTRFQLSGTKLSAHRDMVSSEAFRVGIDAALLQYQVDLAQKCSDANAAMRVGLCILGAQEFVTVLRGLADRQVVVRQTPQDNLHPV